MLVGMRWMLVACLAACGTSTSTSPPTPTRSPSSLAPTPAPQAETAAPAAPVRHVVFVSDPAALAVMDAPGFAARVPAWRTMAAVLAADVARARKQDPESGVGIAGNAHRLFDTRWLTSPKTHFEL